jgi:predicted transposase YbfD/YdcC
MKEFENKIKLHRKLNEELNYQKDSFYSEQEVILRSANHYIIFKYMKQKLEIQKKCLYLQKMISQKKRSVIKIFKLINS